MRLRKSLGEAEGGAENDPQQNCSIFTPVGNRLFCPQPKLGAMDSYKGHITTVYYTRNLMIYIDLYRLYTQKALSNSINIITNYLYIHT